MAGLFKTATDWVACALGYTIQPILPLDFHPQKGDKTYNPTTRLFLVLD